MWRFETTDESKRVSVMDRETGKCVLVTDKCHVADVAEWA